MSGNEKWFELDAFLADLTGGIGASEYILFDNGLKQMSPYRHLEQSLLDMFQSAVGALEQKWGDNFMRRGRPGFAESDGDPAFVADSYHSAYLLIVLLPDPAGLPSAATRIKQFHQRIGEMIVRLPPLGDGGKRSAQMVDFRHQK